MPFWEGGFGVGFCGAFVVIGGRDELKTRAIEGWNKFSGHTPHKPWIDEIKIRCENCGELMTRIPDVGNPWLDAGIVPFSTPIDPKLPGGRFGRKVSYLSDKKYWSEWFPFDFVTESFPGQFKNWFYSLLTMSTVLKDRAPFKTVLGFASLLGEDGRPMHKSWGNSIEFNEAADKIGADVMRWLYAKQDPARNLMFGYKVADEVRRNFHLPLWNIYNFFVTYANFDNWTPKKSTTNKLPIASNILDKWIIARLKQATNTTTESLDNYDGAPATRAIEGFVNDFSTWYIRRSRDRVGPTADKIGDKKQFYETSYFVLVTLMKIIAPFVPFLAETIYLGLTKADSVHLTDWPDLPQLEKREEMIIENMAIIRRAAEAGRAARKTMSIKVRQPLTRALISAPEKAPTKPFLDVLADELNVKEISWKRKRVEEPQVVLQTKLTSSLVEEGKTRDLVREIQELRRKHGLGLVDTVRVKSPWLPNDKKMRVWIKTKTLAQSLEQGEVLEVVKI